MFGRFLIAVSAGLLLQAITTADGAACDPLCQNGGVCTGIDAYYIDDYFSVCDCGDAFVGNSCEFVNPCSTLDACNNGGSCGADTYSVPGQVIKVCSCMYGYSGDNCEVPDPKCSPENSPCLNGGSCRLFYSGTIECVCTLGFAGPTCADEPTFTFNLAVYKRAPGNIVVDGVFYDWNAHSSDSADNNVKIYTVDLDHKPSMITIGGYTGEADDFYGMIVSDSTGCAVSGGGWRCVSNVHTYEWIEKSYDNSAWPAAVSRGQNVDGAVPAVNGGVRLDAFKPNANWIWTAERNPRTYTYCSLKLPTTC